MFSFIAILHAYITLKIIGVGEGEQGDADPGSYSGSSKKLKKKFTCVGTREHSCQKFAISLTVTCAHRQRRIL